MKLFELYEFLKNINSTISYLRQTNLIASSLICEKCGDVMLIKSAQELGDKEVFKCSKKMCKTKKSIRTNSFFFGSKMTLVNLFLFIHLWCKQYPQNIIFDDFDYAKQTVLDWSRFCRDICVDFFDQLDQQKIGGVGKTVEIDESVMVKRKYNRGRLLLTQWVFGGIERTANGEKKFFMELVDDRTENTLLSIISRKIEPGTTIITDGWRSYGNLVNYGYTHNVIIHQENFVHPNNDQIHTQNVENMWMVLKKFLRKHGTNKSPHEFEYVAEFIFRWSSTNFFEDFLVAIRRKYPL